VLTSILSWRYPVTLHPVGWLKVPGSFLLTILISYPEGILFCSTYCAVSYPILHMSAPVYRLFWLIFPLFFRWMPGKYFEVFSNHLSLIFLVSSYLISADSLTTDRASLNNLRSKQLEWLFLVFFLSLLLISAFSFIGYIPSAWVYLAYYSEFFGCILAFVPFCDVHILVYSLLLLHFLFCFLMCNFLLIWRSSCVLLEVWFFGEYSTSSESGDISVWAFRFCYLRYT